ncbi:MAG: DoxX family protein [Terriglobales bacterium]
MQTAAQTAPVSKGNLWAGRIISGLVVAFLLMDTAFKFLKPAPVVETFAHVGIPISHANALGVLCLVCIVIYAIPQTAVLGAVLLTGYMGGAVSTHWRVEDPLFSHVLFPVYFGGLAWLGVCLREPRLWSLLPVRK